MSSSEEGLLVFLIKPGENIGAVRLAPVLLVHHVETCGTIRVNLRDLRLYVTFCLRTACVLEQLDSLAEDLNCVQVRLSFELHVAPLLHLLQLLRKLGAVLHDLGSLFLRGHGSSFSCRRLRLLKSFALLARARLCS